MRRGNRIVAGVAAVDAPAGGEALAALAQDPVIRFDDGASARLDRADPRAGTWAEVLANLQERGDPVHVELGEADRIIAIFIPVVGPVADIRPAPDGGGDLEVMLEASQARHRLRRDNPDFERLSGMLEEARADGSVLAVTSTDNAEIIEAAPAKLPFELALLAPEEADERGVTPSVITFQQAAALFQAANRQSCNPRSISASCIPFVYPDDGCWARAHEMCRIMTGSGVTPLKSWIYGYLRARTRNHPNCQVVWGWHVAPTVMVADRGVTGRPYVIDPSLFTEPVPQAEWKQVQSDPSARLSLTSMAAYRPRGQGDYLTDPNYSSTPRDLATYRDRLRLRAAEGGGPPYSHCG